MLWNNATQAQTQVRPNSTLETRSVVVQNPVSVKKTYCFLLAFYHLSFTYWWIHSERQLYSRDSLTSRIWSPRRILCPAAGLCSSIFFTNIPVALPPATLIPRLALGLGFLNEILRGASHLLPELWNNEQLINKDVCNV